MVTHREALKKADHVLATMKHNGSLKDLEAAIRAYLDARGLVMVPKVPTSKMYDAAVSSGVLFSAAIVSYDVMLAAAPDPFGDAE